MNIDSSSDISSGSSVDDDNESHLYETIVNQDWDDARNLIFSTRNKRYMEFIDEDEGYNVLHQACIHGAPLDIIESILNVSRELPMQQDAYGLTPLRHSLIFSSDDVIEFIIKFCPQAVFIIDEESHSTALHDAAMNNKSLGVFRQLLIANSLGTKTVDLTKTVDDNQETPLDIFFDKWDEKLQDVLYPLKSDRSMIPDFEMTDDTCDENNTRSISSLCCITLLLLHCDRNGTIENLSSMTSFQAACLALTNPKCPWSFFNTVIKIHPEAIYDYDEYGNNLLHIAVLTKYSWCDEEDEDTMISKILFIPDLSFLYNNDHKLPLHLAIMQGQSLQNNMTQVIFKANPKAIETRDFPTHLDPFACSAIRNGQSLEVSEEKRSIIELEQLTASYSLFSENPSLLLCDLLRSYA
eukprot:CAMPEP_0172481510 /NCGR_PEP_ID=MMETSP1066-20121228/7427_1 /TAXON_ID=671091 /ORGANISM="Coscinodiscus wailesii, Strain CCMP2513" /LENGTH=409 /DNA_ID=CAMNT_0013243869 /DNA_START=169 /DNA_END=1398 /DNA_ORIENTATION=+